MNTTLKKLWLLKVNHYLREALSFEQLASQCREEIAAEFGDNGSPNRFPISGGICDNKTWPRELANHVVAAVTNAQDARDKANRVWCKVLGKRQHTFNRYRDNFVA